MWWQAFPWEVAAILNKRVWPGKVKSIWVFLLGKAPLLTFSFQSMMKQKSCVKPCAHVPDTRRQQRTTLQNILMAQFAARLHSFLFFFVVPKFFVAFLRTRGVCRQLPSLFYRKVPPHLESPHVQHILCQWCKSKHLLCAFSIAHERLWSIRGWYALIVLFGHFFDPALWWYM